MAQDNPPTIEAVFKKILELEREHELLTKRFLGIHYWELLRQGILVHNLRIIGTYGPARETSGKPRQSQRRGNGAAISRGNAIFIHSTNRRSEEDGKKIDIYTDAIHQSFPSETIRIERRWIDDRYENKILLTGIPKRALNLIFRVLLRCSIRLRKIHEELTEILSLEGLEISTDNMHFARTLSYYMADFLFTCFIVWKYRPKLAVIICSYGKESFIHAYRYMKIPTVEIQHGIINRNHAGYHFPFEKKMIFPNFLFLWGLGWKNAADLPICDDKIKIVGYPFFTHTTNRNPDRTVDCCVISQPFINDELIEYANRYQDANPHETVVFRLHPKDFPIYSDIRSHLNAKIVLSHQRSINDLLKITQKAVGISSTALFECLVHGVEAYVIRFPAASNISEFIDLGYFEEISPWNYSLVTSRKKINPQSLFEEKNSLVEEIHNILEDKIPSINHLAEFSSQ